MTVLRCDWTVPNPSTACMTGLAVSYPDPDFPASKLHIGRVALIATLLLGKVDHAEGGAMD
jgi:hypothetical protein